jgi:hypothetical protein
LATDDAEAAEAGPKTTCFGAEDYGTEDWWRSLVGCPADGMVAACRHGDAIYVYYEWETNSSRRYCENNSGEYYVPE